MRVYSNLNESKYFCARWEIEVILIAGRRVGIAGLCNVDTHGHPFKFLTEEGGGGVGGGSFDVLSQNITEKVKRGAVGHNLAR